MKEGLLHEIQLPSHMATTLHPIPHPYGTPTTSKILGAGQPIREENSSINKIPNISSKADSIRIQFEAGSK